MPRNALAAGGVFEPDPNNPLTGSYSAADAADWHRQNAADTWQAIQNPQTWQDAADQYRSGMLMGSTAPEMKGLGLDAAAMKVLRDMTPPGFRAYHGSPHSFDQFSSDKIGTGEGAQAFGHGLYFADNEAIAKAYRDALARPTNLYVDGTPWNVAQLTHDESRAAGLVEHTGSWSDARDMMVDAIQKETDPAARQRLGQDLQTLENLSGRVSFGGLSKGHMYEVNVAADPAHMLDWDKPLSEQHPNVQEALLPHVKAAIEQEMTSAKDPMKMSGGDAYQAAQAVMPSFAAGGRGDAELSAKLRAAGIPGIRYLDGGSRAGGEGSRNTVVFDPATIAILRKYGLAGLMAGGGAAASGQPQQ